ncbi:Protein phosphatase 1G [Trichoplax sp. H2]|nr:Protein phosphatase 1G [Trichoplax sp. H2]|eukprot:RDD43318.1 Protein phosphatase 1G [Trichoplax sp. H2]
MGAYLSRPKLDKTTEIIETAKLRCYASCMQGWRLSMEDAHNCSPDFDDNTSYFAVYDGHGGAEVALYCAEYLPTILKNLPTYKEGNISSALSDAFLKIDDIVISPDTKIELERLAASTQTDNQGSNEEVEPNDDDEVDDVEALNEDAATPLQDILKKYENNGYKLDGAAKKIVMHLHRNLHLQGEKSDGNGLADTTGDDAIANDQECDSDDDNDEDDEDDEDTSSESSEDTDECAGEFRDVNDAFEYKEDVAVSSGTTAVVAVIHKDELIVANAGDSRCILCRNGVALPMSLDHKPTDSPEKERILGAGGKIIDGRINQGLNLSRAIGDHMYKGNPEKSSIEQMVIAKPDIVSLKLEPSDEFVVLACDGIWDCMSNQEVVDFIRVRLPLRKSGKQQSKMVPEKIFIEELLDNCLAGECIGDGTGCDNMTCIVVALDNVLENQQRKRKLSDVKEATSSLSNQQSCDKNE